VPVCFFLSCVNLISKKFWGLKGQIRKVLLIQISEMGSSIHAFSAVRRLQRMYPKASIYYLIFKEMKGGIQLLKVVPESNILSIRSKPMTGFVRDTLSCIMFLRKQGIDVAVDFELFSRFSNILSYLSGASLRIGFYRFSMEGLYRGTFQTHKVMYNHTLPISANFMSLVSSIEAPEGEFPLRKQVADKNRTLLPRIESSHEEKSRMWKKLQRDNPQISSRNLFLAINPNASQLLPLRRWPLRNYIELAKKLLADRNVFIVITGISSETDDAQAICEALGRERCIDFTGKTTLRELIDLYNIADVMVSNDSGPPNFASLTMLKTIVLFGPETPLCYKPLGANVTVVYANYACSPCVSAYNHRKSLCKDNKCLKAITVAQVLDLVNGYLRKPTS